MGKPCRLLWSKSNQCLTVDWAKCEEKTGTWKSTSGGPESSLENCEYCKVWRSTRHSSARVL